MNHNAIPYPGIYRACLAIALNNGGINRFRSQRKQINEYKQWLKKHEVMILQDIDRWLSSLSEEENEMVCGGWQDEPDVIALLATSPSFTNDLLELYFDEVC